MTKIFLLKSKIIQILICIERKTDGTASKSTNNILRLKTRPTLKLRENGQEMVLYYLKLPLTYPASHQNDMSPHFLGQV